MTHPALFLGHGSPMLAIEPSRYSAAWQQLGRGLPRPRAILVVSAHWYGRGTRVTAQAQPRTIHDFYGFPPALYAVQYPAAGEPRLAARVAQLLAPTAVRLDEEWGLDHGSWSLLRYLYPQADIPVVQLSLDATLGGPQHYALAQRLAPLRDEGVLVLGSGNVVHNLRMLQFAAGAPVPPWAAGFEAAVRAAVLAGRHEALADYATLDAGAALSVPTPEHYLPLLYVLALARAGDEVSVPVEGMELGSISMLGVQVAGA
ncbi:MAG: 4,5-DOPA dioxygenase extradiol [Gammaproteobacteria bacterium]|nr:4,5-DOPA dioxygenase extradiol [Gammaproteobacteria bacterium]MDE2252165.1 4,5-DOPA dioxygenase extradiol [Gammaproteobacteria bacterium]